MKQYQVRIPELVYGLYTVEAENEAAAIAKAKEGDHLEFNPGDQIDQVWSDPEHPVKAFALAPEDYVQGA